MDVDWWMESVEGERDGENNRLGHDLWRSLGAADDGIWERKAEHRTN